MTDKMIREALEAVRDHRLYTDWERIGYWADDEQLDKLIDAALSTKQEAEGGDIKLARRIMTLCGCAPASPSLEPGACEITDKIAAMLSPTKQEAGEVSRSQTAQAMEEALRRIVQLDDTADLGRLCDGCEIDGDNQFGAATQSSDLKQALDNARALSPCPGCRM